MTTSAMYEGHVRHRRHGAPAHEFRFPLYMMYVDLDELPTLFRGRWLWSARRWNVAWFRRADHLGPPEQPLAEAVRDLVERHTGVRPAGPIRLLTHFRHAGFRMNPISVFYCHDRDDPAAIPFVVAEVNNTPWDQQTCYVLDMRGSGRSALKARAPKAMHVSPFLGMNYDYQFRLNAPSDSLVLHLAVEPHDPAASPAFDATLTLRRRAMTGFALARALLRFPLMPLQVYAGIHWQAFKLWRKRVRYFPHPAFIKPPTEKPAAP